MITGWRLLHAGRAARRDDPHRSCSIPTAASSTPDTYNEVYSVHGSAMVWLVIIPLLTGGFGNLVLPLQIGARDVAFPVAEHAQLLDLPGRRA